MITIIIILICFFSTGCGNLDFGIGLDAVVGSLVLFTIIATISSGC